MPNLHTGIGWLFRKDPTEARRQVVDALRVCGGNMVHAAFALAIHRRQLYRIIYRENLLGELQRIREEADQEPELLASARAALRGGEGGVSSG